MRRDEGVVAEAGNKQHPPRQAGDLHQRRGDAAERGQLAAAQQLLATADGAALAAVNIVDEVDRLDAHRARELITADRQALPATSTHVPPPLPL
jgi:hypothetical protein